MGKKIINFTDKFNTLIEVVKRQKYETKNIDETIDDESWVDEPKDHIELGIYFSLLAAFQIILTN